MVAPRSVIVILLSFICSLTSAVRPGDDFIANASDVASMRGGCGAGQEIWIFEEKKTGKKREHCLPQRSMYGSQEVPIVRKAGAFDFCCNPAEKGRGMTCLQGCLPRSRGEYCVKFCESQRFTVKQAKKEETELVLNPKSCPEGQEMYIFEKSTKVGDQQEHHHCMPRRHRWGSHDRPTLTREGSLSGGDRACCRGQDMGKICQKACLRDECTVFCEDPEYSAMRPKQPCLKGERCIQMGCINKWYKKEEEPDENGMKATPDGFCNVADEKHFNSKCYMLCPEHNKKFYCTEYSAGSRVVAKSYCR